ncbi:MAG: DUF3850 domain-containing protein [Nanoarchaeota archaeon]
MLIEKKIWPEFFRKIKSGDKTFEIRLADFMCKPGDILYLREWDPKTKTYTGKSMKKKVTFVFRTKDVKFWPKKEVEKHGLQVIGFR